MFIQYKPQALLQGSSLLFFEVGVVATENVRCCRPEQELPPRGCAALLTHPFHHVPRENFQGTRGGRDTGISETGLASLPGLPSKLHSPSLQPYVRIRGGSG